MTKQNFFLYIKQKKVLHARRIYGRKLRRKKSRICSDNEKQLRGKKTRAWDFPHNFCWIFFIVLGIFLLFLSLSRNEVSQHNFSLINPENENEKSNLHFQLSLIRRSVWCVMLLVFAFRFASKLKKFFLLLLDGYFPFHIHNMWEVCTSFWFDFHGNFSSIYKVEIIFIN